MIEQQTELFDPSKEDLDLLCNSLNAQAGQFRYSDPFLMHLLLRAQGVITWLRDADEKLDNREKWLVIYSDNTFDTVYDAPLDLVLEYADTTKTITHIIRG